jgi:hypothetical protein
MPDLESLRDPNTIAQAAKTLKDIDRILAQPRFAVVSKDFDKHALKGGKGDKAWYVPLGLRTVSGVLGAVGRAAEYKIFYSTWSETMHSSNYTQHVRMGPGTVTFEPLRHLSGFAALFRFSAATTIHTYRKVLEYYRSGELPAHSRKYSENWKRALMEVPTIKYEATTKKPPR